VATGLVLSRSCSWSQVIGPKFGLDLKIRAQVLGIGSEIKIFQDRNQEQFLIRSRYCIVFHDYTQHSCSLLRTWGLRLLLITGTNIVFASLLTDYLM